MRIRRAKPLKKFIPSFNNQRWTSQNHSVGLKQPLHRDCLFVGVGLVDYLLARRKLFEMGQHLKELLDFAGGLVGVEDLGTGASDGRPYVLDVAWNEHGFTSAE